MSDPEDQLDEAKMNHPKECPACGEMMIGDSCETCEDLAGRDPDPFPETTDEVCARAWAQHQELHRR